MMIDVNMSGLRTVRVWQSPSRSASHSTLQTHMIQALHSHDRRLESSSVQTMRKTLTITDYARVSIAPRATWHSPFSSAARPARSSIHDGGLSPPPQTIRRPIRPCSNSSSCKD